MTETLVALLRGEYFQNLTDSSFHKTDSTGQVNFTSEFQELSFSATLSVFLRKYK